MQDCKSHPAKRMGQRAAAVSLLGLACQGAAQGAPTTLLEDAHTYHVQASGHYREIAVLRYRVDDAKAIEGRRLETISFNKRYEVPPVLQAYVLRPDGSRRLIAASAIRTRPAQAGPAGEVNVDVRQVQIPFTGLQVGDQVVLKARSATKGRQPFPKQFLAYLRAQVPVVVPQISLRIDAPADYPLHSHHRGFIASPPVLRHGRIYYQWTGDGSENIRLEADAADASSFMKGVTVSSFAGAAAAAGALDPYYVRASRPTENLRQMSAAITRGIADPREKALALHRWVQQHVRYRAVLRAGGAWYPLRNATQILQAGYGDCKDHVVVLSALLAAAGIDSSPAAIDWGLDGYSEPDVHHQGSFNHIINYIPALDLYLDATAKEINGSYLPPNELDKVTLLTRSGTMGRTPAHQLDRHSVQYQVILGQDRQAQFGFSVLGEGYRAGQLRQQFDGHAQYAPGAWVQAQLQRWRYAGQGTEDFGDTKASLPGYRYRYDGRIDDFLGPEPEPTFIPRSSLTAEMHLIPSAYLVEKTRTQPFVCSPHEVVEHASYTWPENFDIQALPADVSLDTPVLRYQARYRRDGRTLFIDRTLSFGKATTVVCAASDFDTLAPAARAMQADLDQAVTLVPAPASSTH